ncbi:unnamed protein product [Prunus armeniaca]
MFDATDQMGEEMPMGLSGNFEYRGCRRGSRSEEAGGTDQSGEGSTQGEQGANQWPARGWVKGQDHNPNWKRRGGQTTSIRAA